MKQILKITTIFIFLISVKMAHSSNADIALIKQRVLETLMKQDVNDAEIKLLMNSIREDGTWPGINYEDVSREAFEHRFHLGNMVDLAHAYQSKLSEFYQDKKVKSVIEKALKHWVDNDYICENWWYNQIGTPGALVNLMLLIGDELPDDLVEKTQPMIGRAHVNAPGARPGGDRIKIAGIQAKNCLFMGDYEKFNEIVRIIESEIKYSKWVGAEYGYGYRHIPTGFSNRKMGGRGIQYDNSFHHRVDGVNNTLSYGLGYAAAFAEWAVYVADTKYAFSNEKSAQLIDYFLDGICKTAVFGKYPDAGAKNRSISRVGTLHPYNATLPEKLLVISDYRNKELQEIVDIRKKSIKPTTSHATFFWDSEHFSYQRPDWFTSVRMYSTRNHNMEVPYNSEGLFNHHRGDGVNHISVTGDEYYNIWPVYDYQKIPGTTVMQKQQMPEPREIQKLGETDFVGAVTDGIYGAAAFDFKSPHDPLIARKAWFFFDDEYVCLGAGISCKEDDLPVVTTLNQCLLRDDVTISSNNNKTIIEKGENEYNDVDWVFHDGIGYVFPETVSVHIKNSEASGSWWRINKQSDSPKEEITLDVFKIWLDHGNRPSDEKYEYIVVPAASANKLAESKKNVEIIANSPYLQAVKQNKLQMFQAVFYKAGEVEINDDFKLVTDNPGIVMLKMNGDKVEKISVADPNREMKQFHLSISEKIDNPGEYLNAVWDENEKLTHITILLPQGNYAGDSVTIKL